MASLATQVSSGDMFTQAHVHTACGRRAHLGAGLQHAWPPLQALGAAPSDHIRMAQLEVALGKCTLTSHGDVRTEANATHASWTLPLLGQEAGHRLSLELRAAASKLQLDRRLWWRVLARSSCDTLQ
ncbi:hypothetical protein MC885_021523, partial [Smutsia gigantea]